MKRGLLGVIAVAVLLLVIAVIFDKTSSHIVSKPEVATTTPVQSSAPIQQAPKSLGSYRYICPKGVIFTVTIPKGMKTIRITPVSGSYPPATTLSKVSVSSGVRYEGNGLVFTAHGETVSIGDGTTQTNCSPVELPDSAPFNFGD